MSVLAAGQHSQGLPGISISAISQPAAAEGLHSGHVPCLPASKVSSLEKIPQWNPVVPFLPKQLFPAWRNNSSFYISMTL